jgi:hypothetical protein
MLIKKAEYKKVVKEVVQKISDDIYGCDRCGREISLEEKLELSVFFLDKKLKKQDTGSDSDKYQFCSWDCVCKFLPTVKTDYFISLPYLTYDVQKEGLMAKDLIKIIDFGK